MNFAKLPIDLGIIHYASDTPYTQARTLGARGLSYYGMDSTYASTIAIARRILALEGALRRLAQLDLAALVGRDGLERREGEDLGGRALDLAVAELVQVGLEDDTDVDAILARRRRA